MLSHIFRQAKQRLYSLLRWSEKYTKADMVYFAGGNFWLTVGRIVGTVAGIALTVVFANFLPPETFGTYKYILAAGGVVGALSLSSLGGAITRAIALGKQNVVPGVSRASFLWSIPASFGALVVALYYFWNFNNVLGIGFLLIAITTPFLNVSGLYKSIMLGKKDFRNLAFSSFRAAIPMIGLIAAILLTQNIVIILVTYFGLNLLISWGIYVWTLRHYQISKDSNSEDVEETIRYGKHNSVMSAVSQTTDSLDQLILWHMAGPAQLAIYAFALAPIREIKNLFQNIFPLLFPKYVTKTVAQMKSSAPLRIVQILGASTVLVLVYIISAPFLYTLIFPQYMAAVLLSQILAIGLIFQAKGVVETMLYVQGDSRLRYITVLLTQATKVILWIVLIPLYGVMGAVLGIVIAEAFSAGILWWAYTKLR